MDNQLTGEPVYIIAEAGVNHNGSLDMALELIDTAASTGADAVKFQTFDTNALVSRSAELAGYQQRYMGGKSETQYEMLKKVELSRDNHRILIERCRARGIEFISTPFDIQSALFLACELNLDRIKIASGEITNAPLLLAIAGTGKNIILSTGMSDLDDVESALGVLAHGFLSGSELPGKECFAAAFNSENGREILRGKVVLLHCTSVYPAPCDRINLRAIDTLRERFGLPVGLSDHSCGTAVSVAAVARGACMIEKHFTLDRSLPGPDHQASLEPDELKLLVEQVRCIEKALGTGTKVATNDELENRKLVRKSLVAARKISQGEKFTKDNLTVKRPEEGISPFEFWEYLGRRADRDYEPDDAI